MNTKGEIRRLRKDEYQPWLKLWGLYMEFYKQPLNEEVAQATFHRLVYSNAGMNALVYTEGDELIGFVHYIFHASTWTHGNYCYLQDLYVLPEHRGKGIATQLIQSVYGDAERLNCSRVYWLTHESNKTGISLYNKVADNAGFIQFRKNLKQ